MNKWLKEETGDIAKAIVSVLVVSAATALLQYLGAHISQILLAAGQFLGAITTIKISHR